MENNPENKHKPARCCLQFIIFFLLLSLYRFFSHGIDLRKVCNTNIKCILLYVQSKMRPTLSGTDYVEMHKCTNAIDPIKFQMSGSFCLAWWMQL